MGGGSDDGAAFGLGASAAGLGAAAVAGPAGDLGVNGAGEGVACSVLLIDTAVNTAVGESGHDGLGVILAASVARLCAGGPGGPGRKLAIDGAAEEGAAGGGGKGRAGKATVRYRGDDGAALGLGAGAAGLGATAVARPAGDLAVDGAREEVAVRGAGEGRGSDPLGKRPRLVAGVLRWTCLPLVRAITPANCVQHFTTP